MSTSKYDWNAYQRKYRELHRAEINRRANEWYKRCPDEAKDKRLRTRYGITLYQVRQMANDCNWKCPICGVEMVVGSKNSNATLAVDHDHITGKVRGVLCHQCNRGLGAFKDNYQILEKALAYLKKDFK